MKCVGIDFGLKRVGIATSSLVDSSGAHLALARCTLQRHSKEQCFRELLDLIEAEKPDALVLGLPKRMDGSPSLTTRQVLNFAESLQRRTTVPLYLMDELLSSFAAESQLNERGIRGSKQSPYLDQEAARCILETFLALRPEQRILAPRPRWHQPINENPDGKNQNQN